MKTKSAVSPHIPLLQYPIAPDLEMSLRIILGRGIFERRSFAKFMSHAPRRDTVIEVGAHVGSWTLGFSKLFQNVVGFEPQPRNRKFLNENIARAKADNIVIHPYAAVSSLTQEFQISASGSTRNSGMAHLIPAGDANEVGIPIECVVLDHFLGAVIAEQGCHIDAIKIDVEGMELDVLKGAEEIIHAHRPTILLEVNRHCARYGISAEEVFDYMTDSGYKNVDRFKKDFTFVPK